jgi:quinol monooxygenase YgiN
MSFEVGYRPSSMLIIAGHLVVARAERDRFIAECVAAVEAARVAAGCLDYSITADTVDPARVVIYERLGE